MRRAMSGWAIAWVVALLVMTGCADPIASSSWALGPAVDDAEDGGAPDVDEAEPDDPDEGLAPPTITTAPSGITNPVFVDPRTGYERGHTLGQAEIPPRVTGALSEGLSLSAAYEYAADSLSNAIPGISAAERAFWTDMVDPIVLDGYIAEFERGLRAAVDEARATASWYSNGRWAPPANTSCPTSVRATSVAGASPFVLRYQAPGQSEVLEAFLEPSTGVEATFEDSRGVCTFPGSFVSLETPAKRFVSTIDGSTLNVFVSRPDTTVYRVSATFSGTHTYAADARPTFAFTIAHYDALFQQTSCINTGSGVAVSEGSAPQVTSFAANGTSANTFTATLAGYATATGTATLVAGSGGALYDLSFAFTQRPGVKAMVIGLDSGVRVPGASVTVTVAGQAPVAATYDDAMQAYYAPIAAAPGTGYTVTATALGYSVETASGTITADQIADAGLLTLRPFDCNARVRVFVRKQYLPFSSSPSPAPAVILRGTHGTRSVQLSTTETYGAFTVRLSGQQTATVNPPMGWSSATGTVSVPPGATGDIDVTVTIYELWNIPSPF